MHDRAPISTPFTQRTTARAKMAFHRNRITENLERPLSLKVQSAAEGMTECIERP